MCNCVVFFGKNAHSPPKNGAPLVMTVRQAGRKIEILDERHVQKLMKMVDLQGNANGFLDGTEGR